MRVHINKALKTRCKAIQTALKKYNTAAAALGRPPLDWKNISTYGSLAEFSLLRECRTDIRCLPWTDAANRQAAVYDLKIKAALVEQIRLNVEVRRLATSICDEEEHFAQVIASTKLTNPLLSTELHDVMARRVRVNDVHRRRIALIHALPSFNGDKTLGRRMGQSGEVTVVTSDSEMTDGTVTHVPAVDEGDVDMPDDVERIEDDEVVDELDNIIHFMDYLHIGLD